MYQRIIYDSILYHYCIATDTGRNHTPAFGLFALLLDTILDKKHLHNL